MDMGGIRRHIHHTRVFVTNITSMLKNMVHTLTCGKIGGENIRHLPTNVMAKQVLKQSKTQPQTCLENIFTYQAFHKTDTTKKCSYTLVKKNPEESNHVKNRNTGSNLYCGTQNKTSQWQIPL